LGATGILNALDAINGSVLWSRNAAKDARVDLPGWGFSSSPLVVDDKVIVAVAGTLSAYDLIAGSKRWIGPDGGAGYSSPHLVHIDGLKQILLMSKAGVTSLSPKDGTLLWKHLWEEERIVQPAVLPGGDLLISAGGLKGMRRIHVWQTAESWTIEERWTSTQLKPNFNDIVIHKGYIFGFNGPLLTCINAEDGNRMWRGGRYGGQLMILADQDLLLVLSETGELALVEAVPDHFKELARFPAIKGKTWNHPALAGDILVVRNAEEMAAFQMRRTGDGLESGKMIK
jgi:outer membrane protein assembly factor BamB